MLMTQRNPFNRLSLLGGQSRRTGQPCHIVSHDEHERRMTRISSLVRSTHFYPLQPWSRDSDPLRSNTR